MDAVAFARELADRLREVVPEAIGIEADGPRIRISKGSRLWARIEIGLILTEPTEPAERIRTTALNVLSQVQDFVSEDRSESPTPRTAASRGPRR